MEYAEIENKFADYIIEHLGPSEELDKLREEKFKFLKHIMSAAFEKEFPEIRPHVFCFGSFPLKTYLQDSDLDITVLFEDKNKNCFLLNNSFDFMNKMLMTIQNSLETFNSEKNFQTFTDINLIFADIKLIKFKYGSLAIDVSINNFTGLSKLIFMDLVERKLSEGGNGMMFKRSLIMIKAWCYHEGGILGSNISLMANYALEVLVIYIFNNFSDKIKREVDAFFLFFKIIREFDWENKILHLFGFTSINSFIEKSKFLEVNSSTYDPFWYVDNNSDNASFNSVLNFPEISNFVKDFEKFKDIDKTQSFNSNKKCITVKYLNIIDPMFNNNNLGKSINFHNFTKIKKVVELVQSDIESITLLRTCNDPFKYLNSLLKLFTKSQTSNSSELFFFTLSQPKIIINPYLNLNEETLSKNVSVSKSNSNVNKYFENSFPDYSSNNIYSSINSTMINNFNKLFYKQNTDNTNTQNLMKIEENKYNSDINLGIGSGMSSTPELYVTKEVLDYITKRLTNSEQKNAYTFKLYYEIDVLNELLSKL